MSAAGAKEVQESILNAPCLSGSVHGPQFLADVRAWQFFDCRHPLYPLRYRERPAGRGSRGRSAGGAAVSGSPKNLEAAHEALSRLRRVF